MSNLRSAFAITPDDSNDLPSTARALLATVGGTVKVTLSGDQDTEAIIFTLTANEIFFGLNIRKVHAAGTTATGIIGLQ